MNSSSLSCPVHQDVSVVPSHTETTSVAPATLCAGKVRIIPPKNKKVAIANATARIFKAFADLFIPKQPFKQIYHCVILRKY